MKSTRLLAALFLLVLLLPAQAFAQRICFSAASENRNTDGPTFFAVPPSTLFDGGAVDASGRVELNLFIQPFCNSGGPLFVRRTYLVYESKAFAYTVTPFTATVLNWAHEGRFVFVDIATNTSVLEASFSNSLLTSWTDTASRLGSTLTLQDSERVDPNIFFNAGPELLNIMASAGFPPNLLHFGEDFAFTLTNIREPGGAPTGIAVSNAGEYSDKWQAEGSFSATAGL
ncbi:MAG: hypothetical protein Tsb002_36190 [Wenzhouxiangellaceae bacterium]